MKMKEECRMQNEEKNLIRQTKASDMICFYLLHSTFCISR